MVNLGTLPGDWFSGAHAVSADGSAIAGVSGSAWNIADAVVWNEAGEMFALGNLGGPEEYASASDISANGVTVVGTSSGPAGKEAFIWTADGGMLGLGDLPGGDHRSSGAGVSDDGTVVVGAGRTDVGFEAFFWTASDGMRNLREYLLANGVSEVEGWTLDVANAISADGQTIVGWGRSPDNREEAWLATIPEPHPLGLLLFATILAAAGRRMDRGGFFLP